MFGWYHPTREERRHCGVVLCAPFGHEYLVSYRAYRKLAEALAAAGFPCVHFDYEGCGDSVDSHTAGVQTWRDNIVQAMQALRERSGVRTCALFGARLGGLLAVSVASQEPVAALALLAPVVSGRAYVRELQAFARMSPITPSSDPARSVGDEEFAGYRLGKDAQSDLAAIDLRKLSLQAETALLIAQRDDIAGNEDKLIALWREQGRDLTLAPHSGYAAMMTADADSSIVPEALWREIVDWLSQRYAALEPAREPAPFTDALRAQTLPGSGTLSVLEEVVRFDGLTGVISRPANAEPSRQAVILTNIGTGHHVGNHRLLVQMARALASQGTLCLRFDRAGCGYSRPNPDGSENKVYVKFGTDDVRAAMDFVQRQYGRQGFVLAGLCSGAYYSYHVGVEDPRVQGLIMLNPPTFQWYTEEILNAPIQPNFKSSSFYMRAAASGETWRRLLRGEIAVRSIAAKLLQRALARATHVAARHSGMSRWLHRPGTVVNEFLTLSRRTVRILFVFSADDGSIEVMNQALGPGASVLPDRSHLHIEVLPNTDHTFMPIWAHQVLTRLVVDQVMRS